MDPKETNEQLEQPAVVTTGAGIEAEEYVTRELIRVRKSLKVTQIGSILAILVVFVSMGSITKGFAQSLEPHEAATIAKGLVDQHVNDQIPQFKQYVRERIPVMIAQVPSYVKQQLPIYRANLETQLEGQLEKYSAQSSQQLSDRFDQFLTSNQADVKAMIENGQDPQALKNMDTNLKQMFSQFLSDTQVNGETLQSKIDQSLQGLNDVDSRMKRLADNKNLTDQEKKARRAIAILLKNVDTNPDLLKARETVANVQANAPASVQNAVQGMLSWDANGDAVFTQPGKPPVVLLKKGESAKPMTPPGAPAPAKPAPAPTHTPGAAPKVAHPGAK